MALTGMPPKPNLDFLVNTLHARSSFKYTSHSK